MMINNWGTCEINGVLCEGFITFVLFPLSPVHPDCRIFDVKKLVATVGALKLAGKPYAALQHALIRALPEEPSVWEFWEL